jgi:hypothetical protein
MPKSCAVEPFVLVQYPNSWLVPEAASYGLNGQGEKRVLPEVGGGKANVTDCITTIRDCHGWVAAALPRFGGYPFGVVQKEIEITPCAWLAVEDPPANGGDRGIGGEDFVDDREPIRRDFDIGVEEGQYVASRFLDAAAAASAERSDEASSTTSTSRGRTVCPSAVRTAAATVATELRQGMITEMANGAAPMARFYPAAFWLVPAVGMLGMRLRSCGGNCFKARAVIHPEFVIQLTFCPICKV